MKLFASVTLVNYKANRWSKRQTTEQFEALRRTKQASNARTRNVDTQLLLMTVSMIIILMLQRIAGN